jgi:hypothetical protein
MINPMLVMLQLVHGLALLQLFLYYWLWSLIIFLTHRFVSALFGPHSIKEGVGGLYHPQLSPEGLGGVEVTKIFVTPLVGDSGVAPSKPNIRKHSLVKYCNVLFNMDYSL